MGRLGYDLDVSRSLAQKRRAVKVVERYYYRCGWRNVGDRKTAWYRQRQIRARALAHVFRRQHGRWPWEGPNFGLG